MAAVACSKASGYFPRLAIRLPSVRSYSYIHKPKPKAPHMLGPCWNWRMCYEVHPCSSVGVQKPLENYQWITKTAVIESLPDTVLKRESFPLETTADFRCRATEFFAMQQHRKKYGFTSLELTEGLFQSLLPSVWALGEDFPHLLDSSLAHQPNVVAFWKRGQHNFHCAASPSYILHTNTSLDLFHPDTSFKGNDTIPVGYYHPKSMNMFLKGYNQIEPFCGYKRGSSLSFCHTVLVGNPNCRKRGQFLALGLMSLFSQSVAQALQYGYKLGKDLSLPLTSQAIVTNGRQFTFVSFQLNTLDMEPDMGTWNVLWAGPTLELFEKTQGQELVGFNEECAQLFIKMLTTPPTRVNPKMTGFGETHSKQKALKEEQKKKDILWEERLRAEDERRLLRKQRTQT